MPKGQPIETPWVYSAVDYQQYEIRIEVDFDNTTRAITGGSVYRDAECVYTKIFLGLGPDGTPNTSPTQFDVPAGSTGLSVPTLNDMGLNVIEDVLALQVTAGA